MVKTHRRGQQSKQNSTGAQEVATPVRPLRGSTSRTPVQEEVAASVATPSSVSTRPGESAGVPQHVRKQLAYDIEEAGGIDLFDKGQTQALDHLLNNPDRAEEYSKRRGPLRRKIGNLVYSQWKLWPKEKYLWKVIVRWDIPLHSSKPKTQCCAGNLY